MERVSDCARETFYEHGHYCARILSIDFEFFIVLVYYCARILPIDVEPIIVLIHYCVWVLPPKNKSLGEHVSDSMNGCVVDELLPSYFILRQVTWRYRIFNSEHVTHCTGIYLLMRPPANIYDSFIVVLLTLCSEVLCPLL